MTVADPDPGAGRAAAPPGVPCCRGRPAEAAAGVVGAGGGDGAEGGPASQAQTRDQSSAENLAVSPGCQRTSSAAVAAVVVAAAAVVVVQSELQVPHLIQLILFHCQLNRTNSPEAFYVIYEYQARLSLDDNYLDAWLAWQIV